VLGGGVDSTALELWLEGEERVGFEWEEVILWGKSVVNGVGLIGLGTRLGDVGSIDDDVDGWGREEWEA
jgi:hypothetical protein